MYTYSRGLKKISRDLIISLFVYLYVLCMHKKRDIYHAYLQYLSVHKFLPVFLLVNFRFLINNKINDNCDRYSKYTTV